MTKPDVDQGFKLEAYLSRFSDFRAGETIIGESDSETSVYLIQVGRVKLTYLSREGRAISHTELQPGALFGDINALTNAEKRVSVIAETETRLAVFSHAEFCQILRDDSDVAMWVMKDLAHRLQEQIDQLGISRATRGC